MDLKLKDKDIELKNRKLTEQIKALEILKERFENLDILRTCNQIGVTESDSGRMQLGDKILVVEDNSESIHLPDFVFQKNDE